MMTKIYKLRNKNAAYFETRYCGISVPMTFTMGVGCDPDLRAEMIVTDKFTQDAVEADPRFGKLYFLAEQYGEEETEAPVDAKEEAAAPKKKSGKKVKAMEFGNVNDALYYLEETLGVDTNTDDIDALLKANNIVIKG